MMVLFTIVGALGYYGYCHYESSRPLFQDKDIGILVAEFENDEGNLIQDLIKVELDIQKQLKKLEFGLRKLPRTIQTDEEAPLILKQKNADLLIWGTFIKGYQEFYRIRACAGARIRAGAKL